jgi:hypothetical protein
VRAVGDRLQAPAVDLDPGVVVALPAEVAATADRLEHAFEEHLGERLPEELKECEGELVDADVVVFPVGARFAQRAQVTLLPRRALRVVGDAAVVLHLFGHSEALALPFARLREEVPPSDRSVVGRIETDAGEAVADALAQIEQAAGMGDAGEDGEVGLRDTEGLVGSVGLAPGGDFLASDEIYAGDAASGMNGAAKTIEWGWVVVVDAPA